jgi:hypothetical protein
LPVELPDQCSETGVSPKWDEVDATLQAVAIVKAFCKRLFEHADGKVGVMVPEALVCSGGFRRGMTPVRRLAASNEDDTGL